jgi:hypothetical protein
MAATSDDFAERSSYLFAGHPDSSDCCFSCGHGVHEGGFSPRSGVLNRDGLNASAEDGVACFQLIERGVQLGNHSFGVVGENDQLEIDLFVSHLFTSCDSIPRKRGLGGGWQWGQKCVP